jgi:preprotein translocase subunit SecF
MAIEKLCPPALIYLAFSLTQVILDTFKGLYNTAFLKFWVMLIFTLLLNILCSHGLGIISWIIVFVPFILMSVITTILLYVFGLDPESGSINVNNQNNKQPPPPDPRQQQQQAQQQQQSQQQQTQQPQQQQQQQQQQPQQPQQQQSSTPPNTTSPTTQPSPNGSQQSQEANESYNNQS